MLNTSALSAWVSGIKGYLESWLGLAHTWCCSYRCPENIPAYQPPEQSSKKSLFNYVLYSQNLSPLASWMIKQRDTVLSLAKWIPLLRVISVSCNKKLIHNVTCAEMQTSHRVLCKDVQGNYNFCRQSLDEILCMWSTPGTILINLPHNAHDLG